MLDVMSGGRLIAGLVVGGGPEYYSTNVNPTDARAPLPGSRRARHPGLDAPRPVRVRRRVLPTALREPVAPSAAAAPSAGVDPRPRARPAPSRTASSTGSATWGWRTTRRPRPSPARPSPIATRWRRRARPFDPELLGWLTTVYVAETDEQAVEEAARISPTSRGPWRRGSSGPARCGCRPGTSTRPPWCSSWPTCGGWCKGPRPSDAAAAVWQRSPLIGSPARSESGCSPSSTSSGSGRSWRCCSSGRSPPTSRRARRSCMPPRSCPTCASTPTSTSPPRGGR